MAMKMWVSGAFFGLALVSHIDGAPTTKSGPKEVTDEQLTRLAEEFLTDLRANKVEALTRSVGIPWYDGGTVIDKEEQLRTILKAMADWYDEGRAAAYKVLAAGTYKKLKADEISDLGESDIKKMDGFLSGDEWLVVVGKVVDGEKRPRMYLLVKDRKGKLTVVGAHK
jgi:hypothetical protein